MTYLDIKELKELNLTTIIGAMKEDIKFYGDEDINDDDIGFDEIIINSEDIKLSFYIWDDYKKDMVYFENEVYSIKDSDAIFIRDMLIEIDELEKVYPNRVIRE